ncbi:MAG: TolC family protein [Methylotenera sp.]|nr:TolC family protein [Methylotenera sp.]
MSQRISLYSSIKPGLILAFSLALFTSGCAFQQYHAKPIDPIAINARLQNKDLSSPQFQQYLIKNGYIAERLPIKQWGLDELVYCALFFNPSLDVARAQLRAAEIAQLTALERPIPSINGSVAHSNQANNDIRPYALGLSIDIPFETANKRDIRIDSARHLSEIAKLEIAQTAWQLRNQIAQTFNEYQLNRKLIGLLADEQAIRQEIVNIYQKRFDLGAASNGELSIAKLQFQTMQFQLAATQRDELTLQAKLASNLGLPLAKVRAMNLTDSITALPTIPSSTDAQTAALLNRLDIRIALKRYALAETKLKLEITKQYPDIILSPGYAYEFGDNIWSLGISGLLSILNKNKAAIAEAKQLREVEAAQFEALQAKVVTDVSVANSELMQAQQSMLNQQQLRDLQQANAQRIQRRFAAGDADRLELTFSKLESNAAEKNVLLAQAQQIMALTELENMLQESLMQSNKNPSMAESSAKN